MANLVYGFYFRMVDMEVLRYDKRYALPITPIRKAG